MEKQQTTSDSGPKGGNSRPRALPFLKAGDQVSETQIEVLSAAIHILAPRLHALSQVRQVGSVGGLEFVCAGGYCACTGDVDCNDLFSTGLCGPDAVCITWGSGPATCFCKRA